jgi:hypothetical protein
MKARLSIRCLELEAEGDSKTLREGTRAIMAPTYKAAPRPIKIYPKRFNPQMIEALELRQKIATRRVVNAGNSFVLPGVFANLDLSSGRRKSIAGENIIRARCRFNAGERVVSVHSKIQPADLLWVRRGQRGGTRASSTLTLEVWAVDVSRLHDMTDVDAIDEGVGSREEFRALWCDINGPASWVENPWVWTYRFTVHELNIDELLERRRRLNVV